MENLAMKKIISLATLLFLSACGETEQKQQPENQRESNTHLTEKVKEGVVENKQTTIPDVNNETMDTLKQLISQALTDVSCDDSSQCYVISTGSNPCGGASGYAVLSSETSDQKAVEKSSQEIIRLEKSKHALEGKMGICQHLVKPQAMCSSNKCISVKGDKEVY